MQLLKRYIIESSFQANQNSYLKNLPINKIANKVCNHFFRGEKRPDPPQKLAALF